MNQDVAELLANGLLTIAGIMLACAILASIFEGKLGVGWTVYGGLAAVCGVVSGVITALN